MSTSVSGSSGAIADNPKLDSSGASQEKPNPENLRHVMHEIHDALGKTLGYEILVRSVNEKGEIVGAYLTLKKYSPHQVLSYVLLAALTASVHNKFIQINIDASLVPKLITITGKGSILLSNIRLEISENIKISELDDLVSDAKTLKETIDPMLSADDIDSLIHNDLDKGKDIIQIQEKLRIIFYLVGQIKFSPSGFYNLPPELKRFIVSQAKKHNTVVVLEQLEFAEDYEVNVVENFFERILYQQYEPDTRENVLRLKTSQRKLDEK